MSGLGLYFVQKGKQTGKDNPFYACAHTEKTKRILSEQKKDKGLKYYLIISPDSREYYVTEGLHSFCRRPDIQKYGLRPSGFSNVLANRQRTHKGWTAKYAS